MGSTWMCTTPVSWQRPISCSSLPSHLERRKSQHIFPQLSEGSAVRPPGSSSRCLFLQRLRETKHVIPKPPLSPVPPLRSAQRGGGRRRTATAAAATFTNTWLSSRRGEGGEAEVASNRHVCGWKICKRCCGGFVLKERFGTFARRTSVPSEPASC